MKIVKNCERFKISFHLKANNKFNCHGFGEAGRRHEITESEKKTLEWSSN